MKLVKNIAKYVVSLGLAGFLLWLVFKQVDLKEFVSRLSEVDYSFVLAAILLAFLSYWIRGYRWSLMLEPMGFKINPSRAFLAVNIGYLANLAVPRMGEISRCGVLKRTDNVSMSTSIGTVVAERIVDMMTLLIITFFNLLIEYDIIRNYFRKLYSSGLEGLTKYLPAIYISIGILVLLIIGAYFILRSYKEKLKTIPFYLKVRSLLRGVGEGMTSITKIEKKAHFWGSTLVLWLIYYLMTYIVVFAIPGTSNLSMEAGLTVLVTGSYGMAAPVQGGIGAFHALVSGVLLLYGVSAADGILYATVLHTSQMLGVILIGSISLVITLFLQRRVKN